MTEKNYDSTKHNDDFVTDPWAHFALQHRTHCDTSLGSAVCTCGLDNCIESARRMIDKQQAERYGTLEDLYPYSDHPGREDGPRCYDADVVDVAIRAILHQQAAERDAELHTIRAEYARLSEAAQRAIDAPDKLRLIEALDGLVAALAITRPEKAQP